MALSDTCESQLERRQANGLLPRCCGMYERSALRFPKGGAVDPHSVAVMAQAAQQGVNHRPAAEKVLPLFVGEVCGNDRGLAPVALLHEFEEDVGLLGLDIDVTQFVYEEHIESHEAVEELARGAVSQGRHTSRRTGPVPE